MARPITPPPRLPVREYQTPVITDGFYTELVNRDDPTYQENAPVKRGTLYSTLKGASQEVITAFPNLYFLRETKPGYSGDFGNTNQWVIWWWATDPQAESTYNAEVSYSFESTSYPIYTRIYRIRRDTYDATPTVATGTALTALIGIKVTAAGTEYSEDDTVNIAGGGGATAKLVVNGSGAIQSVVVTKEGSGYDSASLPAVTITTSTGSGATLVAIVQPKTAVLVSQKKVELPAGDPMALEFVQVIRAYRQITGPSLSGQDYNQSLDVVIPFTTQETPAGSNIGTNRKDITPIDSVIQREKTYDPSVIATVLSTYIVAIPDTADLSSKLPHVLQSITGVMSKSVGTGDGDSDADATAAGLHGSFSISAHDTNQSSAAISAEVLIVIKQYFAQNIPTVRYTFYMTIPITSPNSVLAKLTTLAVTGTVVTITIASPGIVSWSAHGLSNGDTVVFTTTGALPTGLTASTVYYVVNKNTNDFQVAATSGGTAINTSGTQSGVHTSYAAIKAWPQFRPQTEDLLVTARKVSIQVSARVYAHDAFDESSESVASTSETSYSKDVGIGTQVIHISPTIHGAISIGGTTSDSQAVAAAAATALTGDVPVSASTGTISDSATAAVSPTSLSATGGVSAMPTSGRYLVTAQGQIFGYGFAVVHAEVVDFANIT